MNKRTRPRQSGKHDKDVIIKRLEGLADELHSKLVSIRRPLLIEFSGTPKSGKTSTAQSLNMFLRRNKFHSHMIGESGSVAPIANKRNFAFNVWTAATSLCWILEALEKKHEFIIIDRGIFDALAWIQWHHGTKQITDDEKASMEGFFLIHKWRSLVDLVILMTAKPSIAIEREHKNLLTQKPGRIMEPATLATLTRCFKDSHKRYGKQFRRVELIDSSALNNVECGEIAVRTTLEVLNSSIAS